jgi:precorrin-2 dehydrogenase/sirohydrochlorin ferrochelatase
MGYYPVLIRLDGLKVLLVGGGKVAERKAMSLLEAGASVGLVARDLTAGLASLVEHGRLTLLGPQFEEALLEGAILVIAATNDKELNRRISAIARRRGILVNAVDQPNDCTFIVPSVMRRGDLIVAVSTAGKSPALSKRIRGFLEEKFGEEYRVFLCLMGALRERVIAAGLPQEKNAAIFDALVDSELLNAISCNDVSRAAMILSEILPGDVSFKDLLDLIGSGASQK